MRIVRTVAELRAVLAGAPRPVALVPTMGALHDGHLALVARARGLAPTVVASLFVNPAQFGEAADLAAYPRDEARDAALLTDAGVDVLFAPDVAVFGQKDAQQLAVVRRLVADLALPTRVEAVPTVRDADGLALSSRNARLPAADRPRALALARALRAAADAAAAGERDAGALAAAGRAELRAAGVEPEYLAVVDPDSFAPLAALDGGPALVAVAARIGGVRLIDNTLVRSAP